MLAECAHAGMVVGLRMGFELELKPKVESMIGLILASREVLGVGVCPSSVEPVNKHLNSTYAEE
jgi:hypothetical protein